jgi:hypothetical protein
MTARKLSGVIPMIGKERDELRRALGRRKAAESALESARAATNRARDLVEEITRQLEDAAADAARVSWAAQDRLKAALRSGASPGDFVEERRSAGGDVAAKLEAARLVVADFKAEENDCEKALSDAAAAVEMAVRDVVLAEAETIAAKWAEVEAEARVLRIRLGGDGDPISRLPGFSEKLGRAIYQNRNDDQYRMPESEIARSLWTNFASALQRGDPDVQIDFREADRGLEAMREERAERRAADEQFVARMRGEAA